MCLLPTHPTFLFHSLTSSIISKHLYPTPIHSSISPTYLIIYLIIYISTHLPTHISSQPLFIYFSLSTHSFIYLPPHLLSVHLYVNPSIHLFIYLFIHHPSLYPFIYPSTHQSIHLSTSICSLPIISIHKSMFVHSSAYNLLSIYPPILYPSIICPSISISVHRPLWWF